MFWLMITLSHGFILSDLYVDVLFLILCKNKIDFPIVQHYNLVKCTLKSYLFLDVFRTILSAFLSLYLVLCRFSIKFAG